MSKKPYDFLVTEKEPFIYVEKSIVRMEDGFLTLFQGSLGKTIVAPSSHLVMMLGAGTSITQEAAIFCSLHDLQVAFARGGCNVHSVFMSGRYQDPERIMAQCELVRAHKLDIAKLLMRYRLLRKKASVDAIADMEKCPDVQALLAWEGRMAKNQYKEFALKTKATFSRDYEGVDPVNVKINIVNNALYSVCTAICLSCSIHPSVGFLHGFTRRGGLAFDLADLFKHETTLPIAFSKAIAGGKHSMYELSKCLKKDNYFIFKEMTKLALLVGEGNLAGIRDFCESGGR